MNDNKKDDKKNKLKEVNLEDLKQVTGGSFENVPRVPEKPIDDPLKSKI